MATASNLEQFGPAWCSREVVSFAGQLDTHISTGEDYDTLTLASIFTMQPEAAAKGEGLAFIPSSYRDFDARNHVRQREVGSYVALTGDIDSGNHPLSYIESLVRSYAHGAAWLIFSSAHARPGDMRWRIVIPLDEPVGFEDWYDAQNGFFEYMESCGVEMDRALDRAGQPVYLPNVPQFHAKSGDRLRGDDNKPLYFERATTGCNSPGLDLTTGPAAQGIADVRRQRAADERERERIREEAERRRANRPRTDSAPIIEDFNRNNPLEQLLTLYGYEQSPRHAEDWRSPNQTSESYATRVIGGKWISLSASDVGVRLGETFKGGCFGDAYDLFVHFEHGGDHKAAFRALYAERRASAPLSTPEPPPAAVDDPGWTEADIEIHDALEPNLEAEASLQDAVLLPAFDAGDFAGVPVTPREWMVEGWEPRRSCVYLTGQGAVGKSLFAQQRMTCAAASLPLFGVKVEPGIAIYITCEDDLAELHRRQDSINEALGITWDDLRGRLFLVSLKGMLNKELCVFDGEDRMRTTDRWTSLQATIDHVGAQHVTIDNVAHVFAGNENIRNHVAAFTGLLDGEAERINGVILLLGHPNKSGDEYSGSTAWENQVRARIFLGLEKSSDGSVLDPDARTLTNSKPNYSKRGDALHFRWHKWAFVRAEDLGDDYAAMVAETVRASGENEAFMRCLRVRSAQPGREVGPKIGPSYAPARFAEMTEAKGYDKKALARAMERLISIGAIESVETFNPKSRRTATVLVEVQK